MGFSEIDPTSTQPKTSHRLLNPFNRNPKKKNLIVWIHTRALRDAIAGRNRDLDDTKKMVGGFDFEKREVHEFFVEIQ